MQKLQKLLGLPVLETETGTQIGEVQEVVLDIEGAVVLGIIIVSATWFNQDQGIAFEDLFSIGRDAIMVRNNGVIQEVAAFMVIDNSYHLQDLLKKQIFTETGLQLGVLVDIAFDDTTGEIKGYQLSDGLFTDLLYGRMMMPLPEAQVVAEDKLIVPESMAKLLQSKIGEPEESEFQ